MRQVDAIEKELSSPIPRSAVSTREGPNGRSLYYLQAHYVIERMNQVFGPLNWSSSTEEVRLVHHGEVEANGKKKHTAHYLARVKVEVQAIDDKGVVHRTSHMGTGYGDGDDSRNPGKAHELAMKEAESDGLKRAIKSLGQSMGLALYDKEQTNVVEDQEPGEKKAAAHTSAPAVSEGNKAADKPPASRPSAAGAHADRGQGGSDRAQLNKNLASIARVLNESGKQPFAATKEHMRQKYGTDVKEQLSDEQATELYEGLKALAG